MPASRVPVLALAVFLLSSAILIAQASGPIAPAIPAAILNAKTVFLSNGGADGGLFPEPFSGDPNRGYFTLFGQLKSAGRFDLVNDPSEADLVMEIHLAAPLGPREAGKQLGAADPLPYFTLTIYDRRTHFVLWTIVEPIELAILQKTHDRNFDDALSRVTDDIYSLTQPNPTALYNHPQTHLGWPQR